MPPSASSSAPSSASQAPAKAVVSYAALKSRKRQAARERIHAQVVHPIETPRLVADPLRHPTSRLSATFSSARLLVTAGIIHGLIIGVFAIANRLAGDSENYRPPERVTLTIVEPPAPEPPAIPEKKKTKGPVKPDFIPEEPEPEKPKQAAKLPPKVSEPIATPEPNEPPPEPVRRRIVGLSMESTVEGATGPSFATGTSRMGSTDRTAVDPTRAARTPAAKARGGPIKSGTGVTPVRQQRAASRIPTRDAVFTKPKRASPRKPPYPATLKAQGIEGNVLVRVDLDETGRPTKVIILKTSGHAAFDQAAKRAALSEAFVPAKRDGKPVPFTLTYSYRFRIQSN